MLTSHTAGGTGFEPSILLLRKPLLGVADRTRLHERRSHLQVQVRDGDACMEWLPIAFPFRTDREFESTSLQQRISNELFRGLVETGRA